MKRLIICLLFILTALPTLPMTALAHNMRITLDLHDTTFHGKRNKPAILYLKKKLRQQAPHLDLSRLVLKKVLITAKSRHGHGRVQLRVGHYLSPGIQIGGKTRHFHDPHHSTFQRIQLRNSLNRGKGPWQLHFAGHITVGRITVVLAQPKEITPRHNPYRDRHDHFRPGRPYPGNGVHNHRPFISADSDWHHIPSATVVHLPVRTGTTGLERKQRSGRPSANVADSRVPPSKKNNSLQLKHLPLSVVETS